MTQATALRDLLKDETMDAAPELSIPEKNDAVRCVACGHRCLIRPGRSGVCRVRYNENGRLRVPGGYVAGLQVDPIEKKPFFHAYPGHDALSFGMLGCDLHCSYCQNWITSQALRDESAVAYPRPCGPDELVQHAKAHDTPVVVSTYNEPLIAADWAVEVFKEARAAGIVCGFVSNGNATPEVLEYIRPYVDLYKVDLKAFRDREYRTLGCTLGNVLESIRQIHAMGFWIELVTLVVPGLNDDEEQLREMAAFIASVSPDIPWHVTAFHPDYRMTDRGATSQAALDRAYRAGIDHGLHFVYPGNRPGQFGDRENTHCPKCGAVAIQRRGFLVLDNRMRGGDCPDCGGAIPGVWEADPPRRSNGTGRPRPV